MIYIFSFYRHKGEDVVTSPKSISVTTPTEVLVNSLIIQHSKWYYTYRSAPAEHIYDKVIDNSIPADYEIPEVVTTDITVTPCPAYATAVFTETEVIPVVSTGIPVIPCPAYATTTFTETKEKSH